MDNKNTNMRMVILNADMWEDNYFDEIFKDASHPVGTHTHTCNTALHSYSHTQTCAHVH
jgi:hypothetical protein